jgi:hypothetical protein
VRASGALNVALLEKQRIEYDALMRLTMSDLRHYADANDPTGVPLQSDVWTLDSWGTWANRLTLSPTPDTNDDPQHVDAWSVGHAPDPRAAISNITRTLDEYPGGDPQQIAVIPPDHDAAGNIVYDGTYIYQYDAWSRLVQVNLAAQPPPGGGPAVGDAVPGTMQLAGPLVKHFTYDGLGRLVRVLSPYPEPGATPPEGWTVAPVRSERLYYDGVRRIQEVYTDPLLALGESAALGDPEAQGEVSQGGEEEGQTLEGEEGQIEQGSGEPGGEDPPGPPPNTFITYLEREYLWGPGDGITGGAGAGLDELIGIFDIDRRAWWTLLDASGDVVAIVDDGASTAHGYGTGSSSTSDARLCAQFSYDAYGSLLAVQQLHAFPDPRTGHKGLHLDRLDAGVADPLTGAAVARHEVGATHAYFVRNRHYAPALGRFLQRDGLATSLLQSEVDLHHGEAFAPFVLAFDSRLAFAEGVGSFAYLGNSPLGRSDALGQFFSLADFGFSATTTSELQSQSMENSVENGFSAYEGLTRRWANYATDQLLDHTWTSDWDEPDDLYRGSAQWAMRTGSWAPPEPSKGGGAADGPALGGWIEDLVRHSGKFTKDAAGIGVYVVYSGTELIYAGRSQNLAKRMRTSMKARGGTKVVGMVFSGPDAMDAAHAMEEVLIRGLKLMGKGQNAIHGMASGNARRKEKFAKLRMLLSSMGVR